MKVLSYLYKNKPEDFMEVSEVSRKILFKSLYFKPKQLEKACSDLENMGFVELHMGFNGKKWASISIKESGMDEIEKLVK